jgi:regulator of RNase E activity RraB
LGFVAPDCQLHRLDDAAVRVAASQRAPLTMFALILAIAFLIAVFGWMLFGDRVAPGEPASKFEEMAQRVETSFDDLRDNGVNVDEPVIWNYMFVHRDYPQLGRFIAHMRSCGYDVAEVNEANDGDTGIVDYEVRLQLCEQHTPETFARKIGELRDLAAKWHLDHFDGWYPEGYAARGEVSH